MAAAAGTTATNGDTSAGDGTVVATTVGTKDPDHVSRSEGQPAAKIVGEKKEEGGGPCGLPFKCVIL